MSASNRGVSETRSVFDAGYELHPIQLRAALATRGRWLDALVAATIEDGTIVVRDPFTGEATRLWNHADSTATLLPGDPVSWNPLYGVLGAGDRYFSVAPLLP